MDWQFAVCMTTFLVMVAVLAGWRYLRITVSHGDNPEAAPPTPPPSPAQTALTLSAQKQLFEKFIALAHVTTGWPALEAALQDGITTLASLLEAKPGILLVMNPARIVTHTIVTADSPISDPTVVDQLPQIVIYTLTQQQQPLFIKNTADHPQWPLAQVQAYPVGSAMMAPLVNKDDVLGILALFHPQPNHFVAEQFDLLQTVAAQIGLALHHVQEATQHDADDRQLIPYKVLRAVGESLEPETVAYIAVETVANLTEWPTIAISTPDDDGRLIIRAAVGISYIDEGINGRAFRTGHTQIVPNPTDPLTQLTYGMPVSALAVPLRRGRERLGVLNIESDQPNAFSDEDIMLVESLADVIVLALDNARLFHDAQNRLNEQRALRAATSVITATLDLNTVLHHTAEQICQLMNVTSVYICSFHEETALSTVLAEYYGNRASQQEQVSDVGQTYDLHQHFPNSITAFAQGQSLLIHLDDPNISAAVRTHLQKYDGYTILVIPLQVAGNTIAYAELWESQQNREFTLEEIRLCQDIAQQAAIAIENARLFKAVADQRSQLEALIKSYRDGVILVGLDGEVLVINEPVLTFLRLENGVEAWIGRTFLEMIYHIRPYAPEAARTAVRELKRVRHGDSGPGEGVFEVSPYVIHWRNLSVMAQDEMIGRLMVLHDITENQLLEKMRDDLTHTMVHDLRSPLTSISITLDLLDIYLGSSAELKIARALDRAHKSTNRMLSMVNAILDISRLESGGIELAYQSVFLVDIVTAVLDMQLPLASEKSLYITHRIPEDLPPIWVDARLIERVFQNLIGNAIKFTPSGGTILVMARVDNPINPSHIIVSVSDTGPGIPSDIRSQLFEKFATGEQENRGSGLGLAFCKMAIEAHGQRIWLADQSQPGATFYFTLPLSKLPQNGAPASH